MSTPKINKEEVSDGYHTFRDLYNHRAALNMALCRLAQLKGYRTYKSFKHHDGTMFDGMFIVVVIFPLGPEGMPVQVSYHYNIERYIDWFSFLPTEEYADVWDGHTPETTIERIVEWLR